MTADNKYPSQHDDQDDAAVRSAPKDRTEQIRLAIVGLAEAHTQAMQQTPNRPWLMHYYDDLFNHSWDPSGQVGQIAQAQGRVVVGTFCVFAPDELIYAAGGFPIRLDAGADAAIAAGEQELGTVNICPAIKSSLGLKLLNLPFAGETRLDLALIPSVCDGKKKLVEIFSRHVPTWMVQVPHTALDPRVRDYWRTEVNLLRENLEEFTGHKIKAKELSEAIQLFNRKRRVIRRLYELRQAPLPPISGQDALLVVATSYHDDPVHWVKQTETLCQELESRIERGTGVAEPGATRLMLAGCPIVPPNWKVPSILEELGGIIVTDELCTGSRGYWYLVGEDGRSVDEMVTALADRYIMCECPCFVPNTPRLKRIIESVRDWQVKGVVYYQLTFCHTLNLEAVAVERALERIGVPMVKIDTDYSEQGAEAMRTRLESFLETLRGDKKRVSATPGEVAKPAPFWMALTLPPEMAGELEVVAAGRIPSGPLTTTMGKSAQIPEPQLTVDLSRAKPAPVPEPQLTVDLSRTKPAPVPESQLTVKIQLDEFQLVMPDGRIISLADDMDYTLGRNLSKSPKMIDLGGYGDAKEISHKHASLAVTHKSCSLEDLGSTNGTSVNGRLLKKGERVPLTGGEEIKMGDYIFHILKGQSKR